MKQVLAKDGSVVVQDVPAPVVGPRNVLVRVAWSCVSVGTEMVGVRLSGMPLYRRALKQPENVKKVSDGLKKGDLKFVLLGKKLKGSFVLVRTRDRQWLLIKHKDEYAEEGEDIAETQPYSVLTKRTLAEIAEDEGGVVKKAATADPKKLPARRGIKRRKKTSKKKVWHSNR